MKKELILWSMALLTLGFVSCSQDKLDNSENSSSKPAAYSLKALLEQPGDGSRTSLTVGSDGTGATQWLANDQIYVAKLGSGTKYPFTYTEDLGNNIGEFETTSAFARDAATTKYGAAYPQSMVTNIAADGTVTFNFPEMQMYSPATTSVFAPNTCPMVAGETNTDFNSTNLFNFKNVCGMLQLQLYTTNATAIALKSITFTSDKYVAGTGTCNYNYTNVDDLNLEINAATGKHSMVLDCYGENGTTGVTLSTDANNPTNFFIVLPPQAYFNGFTIEMIAVDGRIMKIEKKSAATIKRSQILKMPVINFESNIIAYYGEANCQPSNNGSPITFDAAPHYTKTYAYEYLDCNNPAAKFVTADLIWQTTQSLIASVSGNVATQEVTVTPTAGKSGNALVALRDAHNNILWTFHIWVNADGEVFKTENWTTPTASVFMDRYLGALSNAEDLTNKTCMGLFYQWGRMTPFQHALGTNQRAPIYDIDNELVVTAYRNANDNNNIIEGNYRPLAMMEWHWAYANNPKLNTMWGMPTSGSTYIKTVFDPCPAGYRVPEDAKLSNDVSLYELSESNVNNFSVKGAGCYYTYNGTDKTFMAASGSTNYVGNYEWGNGGFTLWSARAYNQYRVGFTIKAANNVFSFGIPTNYAACSRVVRCVKVD